MRYAENAYKTAGLSANEYMDTVTSFSASLLQSLEQDTEAAANYADVAITDMADNANKMGTSMESIQNAYQGFAKQNYTMLDNLKLGYGGTKQEMERLIADANRVKEANGEMANLSIDSFADIVEAIHIVQTEMGITGTTALEADQTISGSISSMKAAWDNLVVGFADGNADLSILIGDFVETAKTAASNLIPAVLQALQGIGTMVQEMAPIISNQVPVLVKNVLPSLLKAGISLLTGLIDGILSALPSLAQTAVDIVSMLTDYLINSDVLSMLTDATLQVVLTLADGITVMLPQLIPAVIEVVLRIYETLLDNQDKLIDAAIQLCIALATGLVDSIPLLTSKVPIIVDKLVQMYATNAPKLLQAGLQIMIQLGKGLLDNASQILSTIPKLIVSYVNGFKSYTSNIASIGQNIVQGVWNGISGMTSWFTSKVKNFFSGIVNNVKSILGIHSPSKVFAGIGGFMAEGLGEGWDDQYDKIRKSIENDMDFSVNASSADATGATGAENGGAVSAFGGMTVNIYVNGAKYSDEDELAETIAERLQNLFNRSEAVWA